MVYDKSFPIKNFDGWCAFLLGWENIGFKIPMLIDCDLQHYKYKFLIGDGVFMEDTDGNWKTVISQKIEDIQIEIPYFDLVIRFDGELMRMIYWMDQLVIELAKKEEEGE